jgi:hypothetical protein
MAVYRQSYSFMLLENSSRRKVIELINDQFQLDEGQEYLVAIYNHNPVQRIDADVEIDGKRIGIFRVMPDSHFVIERPVGIKRKLTFYTENSTFGRMGGLHFANPTQGSIVITISVESVLQTDNDDLIDLSDSPVPRGGTVLGAASTQEFSQASRMQVELDKICMFAKMTPKSPAVVPL